MALQKFTGRVISVKKLKTANTQRDVVHVVMGFMDTNVDIKTGKLPKLGENTMNSISFSFWDEGFQKSIMDDAEFLINKMVTGYCDNITQNNQFYNGTGYVFVLADDKAKPCAPQVQVIHATPATMAPKAPVAPVA